MKILKPYAATQLDLDPFANAYVTDRSPSGSDPQEYLTTLKTGTYQSIEITGIVQDGPHAKIEARMVFQANPLGERIIASKHAPNDDLTIDSSLDRFYAPFTASATRYDDGWRLDDRKS